MITLKEYYPQLEMILPKICEARFGQCEDCPEVNKEILSILLEEVFDDLGWEFSEVKENTRKYLSILRTNILKDGTLSAEEKIKLISLI